MHDSSLSRRDFLAVAAGAAASLSTGFTFAQPSGDRPQRNDNVEVLNPRDRVPVSLIIDDSTCLVNLAHFCIPQFAEVFPDRYLQDWRKLPREIPDDFVREFADWCGERGVKGKYSIVPYPACVGWVDREMPGWTRKQLEASVGLARDRLLANWDIHPEMVTHTWGIDVRTGRPYPDRTEANMENWGFSVGKSADFLTEYLAYALTILKNAGLPCEGVTTPGGFGNKVLDELSVATLRSCRDVFDAEIPHYFRHLYTDDRSVAPRVENAAKLDSERPECVVSIIGGTGDWFGGWDGLEPPDADKYITADLQGGRMVEVIERGEPAVMVCHWPGIYCNGDKTGFKAFQTVVDRLQRRYDNLFWMKLSEIARYWAAKELTTITQAADGVSFDAPFGTPAFTLRFRSATGGVTHVSSDRRTTLRSVGRPLDLVPGTFHHDGETTTACFDLPRGSSRLTVTP
ncbi:MAG: hypothetical protein WBC44_18540 [Planctomycetaceae bacterium]